MSNCTSTRDFVLDGKSMRTITSEADLTFSATHSFALSISASGRLHLNDRIVIRGGFLYIKRAESIVYTGKGGALHKMCKDSPDGHWMEFEVSKADGTLDFYVCVYRRKPNGIRIETFNSKSGHYPGNGGRIADSCCTGATNPIAMATAHSGPTLVQDDDGEGEREEPD
jgi:hypothetical protein